MITQKDYEILGVNKNSTKSDIKIAYKQLAKKYHPDLNKASDAKEKFVEIQNAYEKIINLPAEIPSIFQSSGIPSIEDVFQQVFSKENQEKWKKERERPKPMSEVLGKLVNDIDQYCSEILDTFFVETDSKHKETFEDWRDNFEGLKELKKEIYKKSWKYDLKDDGACMGDEDTCPITKETEEKEREKLCKKCFKATKKSWQNSYKRAIDIGFAYLRAYLEATPKYYKPLRKEYKLKKVKGKTNKKETEIGNLDAWL